MHMSDALLSPAVGVAFWAGTLGIISRCSKKIAETLDEKVIPLMGVMGAFIFAAQMVNFTIPGTGSSGHLAGGMILSIILGPHAAFIVMASVLTIQALFFADGGLLALGCNIWNLGAYPCFIGYALIYKAIVERGMTPRKMLVASLVSVIVSLQLGAFSVVIQTVLSGRSELPFGAFVLLMQPIHLAVGVVEGLITAGVVSFVSAARPELIECAAKSRSLPPGVRMRRILLAFFVIAMISGGILSWYASSKPDGLEWAIRGVYGKADLPGQETGLAALLETIQKETAFLADYTFKQKGAPGERAVSRADGNAWPKVEAGTSLSGVLGPVMMIGLIFLIGFGLKAVRKRRTEGQRGVSHLAG